MSKRNSFGIKQTWVTFDTSINLLQENWNCLCLGSLIIPIFKKCLFLSLPENFNSFLQEHSLLTTQILAKVFSCFFPRTLSNVDFFSSLSTLIMFYFIILFIFFRYIWIPLLRMMNHIIISKYIINLSVVFFSDPTTQFSYQCCESTKFEYIYFDIHCPFHWMLARVYRSPINILTKEYKRKWKLCLPYSVAVFY